MARTTVLQRKVVAMKYTISGQEAMELLARALSLKHDRSEMYFKAAVLIEAEGDKPTLKEITFDFYGERPTETEETGGDANRTPHLSEVFRIVEGATRGDLQKVKSYAGLLADKLEEDGEANSARWLRQIVEGKAGAQIVPHDGRGESEARDE